MARMRAWPYGLRRMAACSTPGGSMSPTNEPMPRNRRGSSLRRVGLNEAIGALGGEAHRFDDVLIARASAQVAAQGGADIGVAGCWVLAQQRHRGDQHACRAEAALQSVRVPE